MENDPHYDDDCFDCMEEDFDNPDIVNVDDLFDDDDINDTGYDHLALLERKGFFA